MYQVEMGEKQVLNKYKILTRHLFVEKMLVQKLLLALVLDFNHIY